MFGQLQQTEELYGVSVIVSREWLFQDIAIDKGTRAPRIKRFWILFFSQKHAAALYAQAADFNKTARFYYMKAQDAYYLANAQVNNTRLWSSHSRDITIFALQASYDDWRRSRRQWDYFYRRK